MNLTLTTWEREYIRLHTGSLANLTVDQFRVALQAIGAVALTDVEKEAVGYAAVDQGATWKKLGHTAEIQFNDEELELVRTVVENSVAMLAANDALSVADGQQLVGLCDKLGLSFWEIAQEVRALEDDGDGLEGEGD